MGKRRNTKDTRFFHEDNMTAEAATEKVDELLEAGPGFICPYTHKSCDEECVNSLWPKKEQKGSDEWTVDGWRCGNYAFLGGMA